MVVTPLLISSVWHGNYHFVGMRALRAHVSGKHQVIWIFATLIRCLVQVHGSMMADIFH